MQKGETFTTILHTNDETSFVRSITQVVMGTPIEVQASGSRMSKNRVLLELRVFEVVDKSHDSFMLICVSIY
jgi:hypothetical protein